MQKRKTDLTTVKSWREINEGLSEPTDDILEMIDQDKKSAGRWSSKTRTGFLAQPGILDL